MKRSCTAFPASACCKTATSFRSMSGATSMGIAAIPPGHTRVGSISDEAKRTASRYRGFAVRGDRAGASRQPAGRDRPCDRGSSRSDARIWARPGIRRSRHRAEDVGRAARAESRGLRTQGVLLRPGMTLAIEPMVNIGGDETEVLADGWTVVTRGPHAFGALRAHDRDHPRGAGNLDETALRSGTLTVPARWRCHASFPCVIAPRDGSRNGSPRISSGVRATRTGNGEGTVEQMKVAASVGAAVNGARSSAAKASFASFARTRSISSGRARPGGPYRREQRE